MSSVLVWLGGDKSIATGLIVAGGDQSGSGGGGFCCRSGGAGHPAPNGEAWIGFFGQNPMCKFYAVQIKFTDGSLQFINGLLG
ncbi:hypothetical protein [Zobellella taiwanensis]|jgi:hypothetical protein|uniref:hypothetical protein n=1 Tax=Zobellella taiwanensis TaxID=347535 RepID=UPI0011B28481|nr:hypothetical protein [Zobellella taiwanensis]